MQTIQIQEVGRIKEIRKSIAKITGLTRCMIGQLVHFNDNAKGIVVGFNSGEVVTFLLGRIEEIRVGDPAYSSMEPFTVPAGEAFLGRIVNALAEPMDGRGSIQCSVFRDQGSEKKELITDHRPLTTDRYPVFRKAPGVLERVPLSRTFETGILTIDATIPIGKGQRELIIGDRLTGKTSICTDAILNQRGKDVICIYCCIGRTYSSLLKIVELFKGTGALDYTIVVAAHAASSGGEQYLTPYTACALGEYFMDHGRDVFVVFDDLTKHAWAYRQLSLLLERPPGRDAYPGDIFYLHSQLMERAGQYSPEFGGGSMTFFPVVDTLQGDVTGYIPSNLVSMTDGQIYMNTSLFNSGFKPAIDLGLSVSRVGNKVQCPAVKELSGTLRLEYVRYNELLKITRFKANVSETVNQRLREGEALTQFFLQMNNDPYPLEMEVILLYALRRKILTVLAKGEIDYFKKNIYAFMREKFPDVIRDVGDKKELTPELRRGLDDALLAFFKDKGIAVRNLES
ncbi:MAG TPA: F0F1 ATP synthase subunit alpha [Candidatus Omnitrophica bacterium]|nr:F0F1 ATP synthase subunit alpha [Candidatus Omnitrophota bacterium]HCI45290.1 F0F1 ATP synthase subunit alpha [Candidatus Omnitrophota bacterium]